MATPHQAGPRQEQKELQPATPPGPVAFVAQAQGDIAESAGPEGKSPEACAGWPPAGHTRVRHSTAPSPPPPEII